MGMPLVLQVFGQNTGHIKIKFDLLVVLEETLPVIMTPLHLMNWDISLRTTYVSLLLVLEGNSGIHQSY